MEPTTSDEWQNTVREVGSLLAVQLGKGNTEAAIAALETCLTFAVYGFFRINEGKHDDDDIMALKDRTLAMWREWWASRNHVN